MKLAILTIISLLFAACSSLDQIDTSTVAGQYQLAEAYEKNERYQEAILKFTDIKNQHPYSRFASQAELKIADIHFKREAYGEAKLAYQIFQDYHPSHPKIDYVIFRIAMSSYHMLPEDIDRDLSESREALATIASLIRRFPKSEYVVEARKKKAEILKKLSEKELYIADFYFKKKLFKSSLGRYENVLQNYPNLGLTPKALLGASLSALEADQIETGKKYLNLLYSKYPNSAEAAQLKTRAKKYGIR